MPQRSHLQQLPFYVCLFVYPTAQFVVIAQQKTFYFLIKVDFKAI